GQAAAERFARRALERLRAAEDPIAEAHAIESEESARTGRHFRVSVEELPPAARGDHLVPEYLDAIFGLDAPGVLTEPVRTSFGWHAIVLTEIVPAWRAPADEVEEIVREELAIEARAQRLEELVRELAGRTAIELDQAAIAEALQTDLLERGGDAP
nr:peptidylprolyl isomerase [Myxococcota bacterium]